MQVERWTKCLLRTWLSRIPTSCYVDNALRHCVDAAPLRGALPFICDKGPGQVRRFGCRMIVPGRSKRGTKCQQRRFGGRMIVLGGWKGGRNACCAGG